MAEKDSFKVDRASLQISKGELVDLELHLLQDLTSRASETRHGIFHHRNRKLLEQLSVEAQDDCFPEQNS